MLNSIKIRQYTPHDKIKVIELFLLNTPLYFSEEEKKDLENYLDKEIDEYFIVENYNAVIAAGGINYSDDPTMMKLSWDMVHPDFHKKGVGRSLLNYRIHRICSFNQVKSITVRTSQLAYAFYEKNGFRLIETDKNYWAKGFDLYKMELTL